MEAGVALWDVCEAAHRPGSLDASIDSASMSPNRLAAFFASHPSLQLVCFNGAKAADLFRRKVLPDLDPADMPALVTLPSTSPANAAMRYEEKLARWAVVRTDANPRDA